MKLHILIIAWRIMPGLLLLIGFCLALSACVSSVLSTTSQMNEENDNSGFHEDDNQTLNDNDEQLFFQSVNDTYPPVPLQNQTLIRSAETPVNASGLMVPVERGMAQEIVRHNSAQGEIIRPTAIFREDDNVSGGNNKQTSSLLKPFLSFMPGVKSNSELFGTSKKSSNILVKTRLASITTVARSSSYMLRAQNRNVKIDCIRPEVIKLVRVIERHYGKRATVTSGYRGRSFNRKAGGARKSMHMYCKAVDIQIKGVSKWNLAKFARSIPGRGGVGTYCRTRSVHIDTGSRRDWHHPCRGKLRRRHL